MVNFKKSCGTKTYLHKSAARSVYNGFNKEIQRKLLEHEFNRKNMDYVTSFIKNSTQARPRYNERKAVQSYNCQGFGHFSGTCKNKKIARNTTGPWRADKRDFK